ncbi:MAG: CBS domain-containing protein [Clostridiales bacterium]|uniref:CBS domain-containing protein n=1 Tax=Clostridium sp. N3C TaxID=1776758 RepID=UPI00092E1763|nr:CBS domain-containing protein [Clostridium sp. N3C]NLZ47877.1 CBS domain-containing protein [Clostridiales bacterium]SCN26267.1 Hypoxic response protein 1 [Clostridium sp. N3C]
MKVRDVMTRDVACVDVNDNVERAAQLMNEYNVGSVPVCENGKVVGIITDRDITLRSVAKGAESCSQTVREIMSSNPVCGSPDQDVHDAARIMSERQIRRLPIVENGRLVGMISLGDIAVEPTLKDNAEEALKSISEPCSPNM